MSLKDLQISGTDRKKPRSMPMRFSAGNPFGGMLSEFGKLETRAGAGSMYDVDVYSLQIARSRWLGDGSGWNPSESGNNHSASINDKIFGLEDGEGDTEVFVPAQCLEGLVPQTLLEQYRFWQTGPNTLRVSTWRCSTRFDTH